jgi:hypothetical protein
MPRKENQWDPELIEKVKEAYHGEYNIEQSRAEAIRRLPRNHDWRKAGPYAVCYSCHSQHSAWIGALTKLEKDSEGNYVITPLVFDDSQ